MNIAVTGATGFLGRYLLQHFRSQGHTCRCWYRPDSDRSGLDTEGVEWIPGRLNDAGAAAALLVGCDTVVHAALDRPHRGFRGAEGDVVEFVRCNVLGTLQLIEAARIADVRRFVLISTCAVHERILDDRPLNETHPTWPLSHYGAHKAALEMFVHSYGWGQGFPICALRPTGIYGVAHPPEQSKWYDLIAQVVRGETVSCDSGGKEVHAHDVARAAERLLEADGADGECFNCYDRYVSTYEVARLAREYAGSNAQIEGEPRQPKHQIVTDKLAALGVSFGGESLLHATVKELVEYARHQGV